MILKFIIFDYILNKFKLSFFKIKLSHILKKQFKLTPPYGTIYQANLVCLKWFDCIAMTALANRKVLGLL